MDNANTIEQTAQEISSLQSSLNSLQSDVQFTSLRDQVADLEGITNGLSLRVKNLRTRNYVFSGGLEATCENLPRRWVEIAPGIMSEINQQANTLQAALRPLESRFAAVTPFKDNPPVAKPMIAQLKAEVENLNSKADACERSIRAFFEAFKDALDKTVNQLDHLEWMMSQTEEASFLWQALESCYEAVKAIWKKNGEEQKDDPDGILYLTDRRIVFEQKQEVATKKFLFITTETEKIQKLLFEAQVELLEKVGATKEGFFKNEDHIEIRFASGAPFQVAYFHIFEQDCNAWQVLLNRAKTHDFDHERAVPLDATAVARVKAAPTVCPNCGATLRQPVQRGMETMTCEFCGKIIKL